VKRTDSKFEGKNDYFMDVDRMTNEGLGGGQVTKNNGEIDTATEIEPESNPTLNRDKE
jgi:hypothetical protein